MKFNHAFRTLPRFVLPSLLLSGVFLSSPVHAVPKAAEDENAAVTSTAAGKPPKATKKAGAGQHTGKTTKTSSKPPASKKAKQ